MKKNYILYFKGYFCFYLVRGRGFFNFGRGFLGAFIWEDGTGCFCLVRPAARAELGGTVAAVWTQRGTAAIAEAVSPPCGHSAVLQPLLRQCRRRVDTAWYCSHC